MVRDQASMPPDRDWACSKPCWRSHMVTLRERAPWWQRTTMWLSGSSAWWARAGISPMGMETESGRCEVWNSQGSRTSRRMGGMGWVRSLAKASGVISGESMRLGYRLERRGCQCGRAHGCAYLCNPRAEQCV